MPFAELKDIRVHYELSGSTGSPTLVLSNSLGTTFSMWDAQIAVFSRNMRVLRYDSRGHGQTSVTPGPYTIEQLGRDVLALVNSLKIDQFAFCGLSKGGMIGMWLGINAAERLTSLAVCNTGAKIGTLEGWNARIDAVRANGMRSISTAVVERWFTSRFREKEPDVVERTKKMVEATNPEGYAASCAAVRDADLRASIAAIRTRTLVVSGAHDPATPPSDGRFIAENITGARYLELDAAHLSNIEAAERFTTEVGAFLTN